MNKNYKKIFMLTVIALIAFVGLPKNAFASTVTLSCDNGGVVKVGDSITCTVYAEDATKGISAAQFGYSMTTSNAGIQSASFPSTWQGTVKDTDKTIYVYGNAVYKRTVIGTIKVKGSKVGKSTLTLRSIKTYDKDGRKETKSDVLAVITVQAKTTAPKITSSSSATKATTKPTGGVITSKKTTKTTTKAGQKPGTTPKYTTSRNVTYTTRTEIFYPTITTSPGGIIFGTVTTERQYTTRIDGSGNIVYETSDASGSFTKPSNATTLPFTGPGGSTQTGDKTQIGYVSTTGQGVTSKGYKTTKESLIDILFPGKTQPTRKIGFSEYENYERDFMNGPTWETTTKFANLKIKKVTVDDYKVRYIDGVFYATTTYEDDTVIIGAEPVGNAVIYGTGERKLTVGKNLVELKVVDRDTAEVAIYPLVITRPDTNEIYNTYLHKLEVVGYDIDFKRDVLEYTLFVPYNLSKVYVWGQAESGDSIVLGEGVYILNKEVEDNTIYVLVSYGDLQSTQYAIHIKRTYRTLIPWFIVGFLVIALATTSIVMQRSKKKLKEDMIAEKDKELVEAKKRAIITKQVDPQLKVNGEDTNDIGRKTVAPTLVPKHVVTTQKVVQVPGKVSFTKEEEKDILDRKVQKKIITPTPMMQDNAPAAQTSLSSNETTMIKNAPIDANGPYNSEDIVITNLNK